MTPSESVVLRYVMNHPMTRRKTVVEALSYGDWEAGHKIRVALDMLVAMHLIQKVGTGVRNLRYTVPINE